MVKLIPFHLACTHLMLWGVLTPEEGLQRLESQKLKLERKPLNLEEQALSLVGTDIYNTLIRDYTKNSGRKTPKEFSASTITRLPVRMTWDNNYFFDKFQGIPIGGYTNV